MLWRSQCLWSSRLVRMIDWVAPSPRSTLGGVLHRLFPSRSACVAVLVSSPFLLAPAPSVDSTLRQPASESDSVPSTKADDAATMQAFAQLRADLGAWKLRCQDAEARLASLQQLPVRSPLLLSTDAAVRAIGGQLAAEEKEEEKEKVVDGISASAVTDRHVCDRIRRWRVFQDEAVNPVLLLLPPEMPFSVAWGVEEAAHICCASAGVVHRSSGLLQCRRRARS